MKKKRIIVLTLILINVIGLGLICFICLNKQGEKNCESIEKSEELPTTQEKALEQMFINNEIQGFESNKTDEYEQTMTKVSCKTMKQDDKGRYLMRCELNVTYNNLTKNIKYELIDEKYYFGYMETLTGGKYRMLETSWYSDFLMKGLCWNLDREEGLDCDDSITE